MSADRPVAKATGLAVAALAVCCGLPVLLSLGAGVAIAGVGLRNWALAVAGLAALVLGVMRFRRSRACDPVADGTEGPEHSDRRRTG